MKVGVTSGFILLRRSCLTMARPMTSGFIPFTSSFVIASRPFKVFKKYGE